MKQVTVYKLQIPYVVSRILNSPTLICITCSPLPRIEVDIANSGGPSPETQSQKDCREEKLK